MICIIMVAGHDDRLERDICRDATGQFEHLNGVPKALLPLSLSEGSEQNKTILCLWWEELIKKREQFSEIYLVTNADKFKFYERWATAHDFPPENIINDGTTKYNSRLGAVADLDLVIRKKGIADTDVMVVAGDMIFSRGFDISVVHRLFSEKKGDIAMYYELTPEELASSRGIVELDSSNSRITAFYEKPAENSCLTSSRLASVCFYVFRSATLPLVRAFLESHPLVEDRKFGNLLAWLIGQQSLPVFGQQLPTAFHLIGQSSLQEYVDALAERGGESFLVASRDKRRIKRRAYARVGLVGNPSDGFFGKTIAVSIANFWAEATINESARLRLIPHPLNDPNEFGSLCDLHGISCKEGYQGGLILLQATCKKFYEYCTQRHISLVKRNFTLRYTTNIPRQVGLAGSSAIVTAVFQCLMEFFGLSESDIPKALQPTFVLSVEMEELLIQAGLQDRVIQTFEGCMYMDFARDLVEKRGYGEYERLPVENLPPLWIAYLPDPSNSGKIHSDVKARWKQGDVEVIEAMNKFAELTDQGRDAILSKDWVKLGAIMNENFSLRRKVYGDPCLGAANLQMIEIAQSQRVPVKFPGSGGAVVGMCDSEEQLGLIKSMYENRGYVFVKVEPHKPGIGPPCPIVSPERARSDRSACERTRSRSPRVHA